jgi:hypothetical protein
MRWAERRVRLLVGYYLGLCALTLVAVIVLHNTPAMMTSIVWMRGIFGTASASLMALFATQMARGSSVGYRRLRLVSAILLVTIVAYHHAPQCLVCVDVAPARAQCRVLVPLIALHVGAYIRRIPHLIIADWRKRSSHLVLGRGRRYGITIVAVLAGTSAAVLFLRDTASWVAREAHSPRHIPTPLIIAFFATVLVGLGMIFRPWRWHQKP